MVSLDFQCTHRFFLFFKAFLLSDAALSFYLFEERPLRVPDMCSWRCCTLIVRWEIYIFFLEFCQSWDKDQCPSLRRVLRQTGYRNKIFTSETFDNKSAGSDSASGRVQIKGASQESLIWHPPITFTQPKPFVSVDPKFHPPPPLSLSTRLEKLKMLKPKAEAFNCDV